MKLLSLITIFIIALTISFSTDAKQKDQILNYDIEGAGTGAQGTYMVKVTVISKDKKRHSCISPWQYNHVIQRS